VEVHEDVVQLGGEHDDGTGELLTQRIVAGVKTVLATPAELLDAEERAEIDAGVGRVLTLIDPEGEPVANLRVTAVFETTWGRPDPRLVAGEGFGDDRQRFRAVMGPTVAVDLEDEGASLHDDTVLVVEVFELVETAD
jgi:uncharacterized protein YhfF